MTALTQVSTGQVILASHHNEIYNLLKGVASSGEAITLIYNAAGSVVIQPSSDPAAATEAIQIKNNAGTVQSALSFDGRFYAADGAVGTPGVTFESEKTSGLYRIGASDVGLAIAGVKVAELTATATTIVQALTCSSTLTVSGASIAIGTTPATADVIRIPNNTWMRARDAGNTANIPLIGLDNSNTISIGGGATNNVTMGGAAGGRFLVSGTLTAGGLLGSAIQVGTSGPLIYSGSGAPTISAAVKGSLYLRSDGSSTSTRAYIASDTVGGWTAITTAA